MPDAPFKHRLEKSEFALKGINLTEAIHLICHAGYPDPRSADGNKEEEEEPLLLLQRVIDSLCSLSMHDGLTGLTNLRFFKIALNRETHRAARDGTPCVLLMLDVDYFKSVNDRHGHPVGDIVLQTIAKRLKHGLRPGDTLARYGGEEFAVILPNCPLKHAVQVAERLRLSIAKKEISVSETSGLFTTISIGVAETNLAAPPDPGGLVKSADENLYKAKSLGRNQIYYESLVVTAVSSKEKSALFQKTPPAKRKK